MNVSDVKATPLRTSAFDHDPLQAHRAAVKQALAQGPAPSVQVQLSPFGAVGSPLEAYLAQARADVVYGRAPLGQLAPPVDALQSPSYTRGSYTPVDGPDLTVTVELGPILWSHVSRGSPAARLLSEHA